MHGKPPPPGLHPRSLTLYIKTTFHTLRPRGVLVAHSHNTSELYFTLHTSIYPVERGAGSTPVVATHTISFSFFFVHTSCPYSHPAPFLFFFFFFSLCQIVRRGTKAYPLLLIINHVSCRIAWLHDEQQMDRCRGTIITGGEGERIGANLKLRSLPGLQEGAAVLKKKRVGGEGKGKKRGKTPGTSTTGETFLLLHSYEPSLIRHRVT